MWEVTGLKLVRIGQALVEDKSLFRVQPATCPCCFEQIRSQEEDDISFMRRWRVHGSVGAGLSRNMGWFCLKQSYQYRTGQGPGLNNLN